MQPLKLRAIDAGLLPPVPGPPASHRRPFSILKKLLHPPALSDTPKAVLILVPETKRIANLAKHEIDLNDFEHGFSWDRYLAGPAKPSRTGRVRERYIGLLEGRTVVAIVSPLGTEALAVISVRPANDKERAAYDQA